MSLPHIGDLLSLPALENPGLLAEPVARELSGWEHAAEVAVVEIDPDLADTAAMSKAYDVPLTASANCVVVSGRRGGEERVAACVVRADTRGDVEHLGKGRTDARRGAV